jgi:hypothetical protein
MSEIKVNKLTPRTNCGTVTLGDSGDTFTIPAGATINNLGTASGFGATGAVNWDVASIKTVDFTAVSGNGYFVDTATTGAVIVTLPAAPSVGDVVGVSDYANNFNTANCTLNRNSLKIGGQATNATLSTDGVAVTLVYVDVTKGWIVTDSGNQSDVPTPAFVAATGGCITTTGNYKIHTFFSPGTLVVSCAGNVSGSNTVDYMVVAGGGGGGAHAGGGGGAGGFRESPGTASGSYTVSPRGAAPAVALPVSATPYAVVVGGGGPGGCNTGGTKGTDSSFSTITSTGGGYGGGGIPSPTTVGGPGGSAGGGGGGPGCSIPGGTGNDPPTNPAQGTGGGNFAQPVYAGGGGGGAICAGTNASPGGPAGPGGIGAGTAINLTTMPAPSPTPSAQIGTPGPTPSVRYFAGGGGGSIQPPNSNNGTGGAGGGGTGVHTPTPPMNATINTGGGAGGGHAGPPGLGGTGGSGIVVIRYKYQ